MLESCWTAILEKGISIDDESAAMSERRQPFESSPPPNRFVFLIFISDEEGKAILARRVW